MKRVEIVAAQTSDTKTELMDSAESAAKMNGYDGFSFAVMAADVGIRKASIHYHFPTKADLAVSLMVRYNDQLNDDLTEISASENDAGSKLTAFVDRYRKGLNEATSLCLCVALSISRDRLDEAVIDELRRYRSMGQEWLTQVFRQARKDGSITGLTKARPDAAATLAMLEGAQLGARAEGNMARFEMAVRPLMGRVKRPD
jgi:TetR/AcrR family transcriptional repressor of nem operon